MKEYEFHDAAAIFELMTQDDFEALVEDIRTNGLREPIGLYEGKVLDGRNRYRACILADVKRRYAEIDTDDPVAYVMSMNLQRRHLDASQRAMAANRAREVEEKMAKERQKIRKGQQAGATSANLRELDVGKTSDKLGEKFGVSGRLVDMANKVQTKGAPTLVKAVNDGDISVSTAAQLTELPLERQEQIAKIGPRAAREHIAKQKVAAKDQPATKDQPNEKPRTANLTDRRISKIVELVEVIHKMIDKPTEMQVSWGVIRQKVKELYEFVSKLSY